jgi:hypothetical protein
VRWVIIQTTIAICLYLSLHIDLEYGLYCLTDLHIGHTAGVTCRHGMLFLPRHLIQHLKWPGVRVSLILTTDCSVELPWTHWFCLWIVPLYLTLTHWCCLQIVPLPDLDTLMLSAHCSVTWSWHTDVICGLFRYLTLTHWCCLRIVPLPDLDTLMLSADCSVTWPWHTDVVCELFRYLTLTHWCYLRIVPLPDLDTLMLSADCSVTWPWHTDYVCS